ncbi:MAG TPA: hypothetical protein VNN12_01555 [Dehalococcoidia bacterium]|nr:hypothetical protein [Dehalococcoidia bacterium]
MLHDYISPSSFDYGALHIGGADTMNLNNSFTLWAAPVFTGIVPRRVRALRVYAGVGSDEMVVALYTDASCAGIHWPASLIAQGVTSAGGLRTVEITPFSVTPRSLLWGVIHQRNPVSVVRALGPDSSPSILGADRAVTFTEGVGYRVVGVTYTGSVDPLFPTNSLQVEDSVPLVGIVYAGS